MIVQLAEGMSWTQANLLARRLSWGWGGICGTTLAGGPFSQVTASQAVIEVEGGRFGVCSQTLITHPVKPALGGPGWPVCSKGPTECLLLILKSAGPTCMKGLNLKIRMYELSRFGW